MNPPRVRMPKSWKQAKKRRSNGVEEVKMTSGTWCETIEGPKISRQHAYGLLSACRSLFHSYFLSFFLSFFKSVMAAKTVDVMYFSHTLPYIFVLWQFISYHFNFKLEYENRKKIIQVQNDGHGTRIHWTRHVCLYKSIKVHESPFFFF